ncbi:MAG: phasin family protein [Janthinobacterium lividum]
MDDLFKKFINTGVGFLSQGNKAVQTAIEKLVKESKISEQEGKKIVDDLLKGGEAKRADLEKQFQGLTADLKSRVSLKGKGQDQPAAPVPKAKAAPKAASKPVAKKPAASPATEAAGTVKKAADKVSAAAGKAQRSAAAKAGAPKKAAVQSADDSGEALDSK